MTPKPSIVLLSGLVLVAACAEEPPPRSVQFFLDNPIVLEAVMVRCAQNRAGTRYDAECVNARQAVTTIEAREERIRREVFERRSEQKRKALIRTQKAAAEARRRAAEAERLREEAEYLAQFGELPPTDSGAAEEMGNLPGAMIPTPSDAPQQQDVIFDEPEPRSSSVPAADGGNAPVAESEPTSDLDAVRDELRRRGEESSN